MGSVKNNPTPDQIRAARGGKRAGSGRKPEGKIQVSYKLATDVVEFLRSNEKPASQLIENAVRKHYGISANLLSAPPKPS